jgi:hypothetical protein
MFFGILLVKRNARGPDFGVVRTSLRLVYVTVLYADGYFEEEPDVHTPFVASLRVLGITQIRRRYSKRVISAIRVVI